MTKLLIGLGLLILFGALFSLLLALKARLFPPEQPSEESAPTAEKEPEEKRTVLRAVVHCAGGGGTFLRYEYEGIRDCLAASLLPGGGPLKCEYGCLGLGTCEQVCSFDAIRIRDGVARVEGEACTGCGECVSACPRHIISLEPYQSGRHVSIPCASAGLGEGVGEVCADGCTGCSICVEACPRGAITVEEGLPRIDYETCDHCARCASSCPRHLIRVEKVEELPQPEPPKEPRQPRPKKEKREKPPKEPKPRKEKPEKPPKEPKPKKEKAEKPPLKLLLPKKEKPAKAEEDQRPKKEKRELPKLKLEKKHPQKPEKPAEEEKKPETPSEDGPKTSAEAFEAFAQMVAAAGEVLGEEKPEEKPDTSPNEEKPE